MAAALQSLTGAGCNVVKARYTLSDSFRAADEVKFAYATEPDPAHPEFAADYQTSAVGMRFLADGRYKVTQSLRGIDDRFIVNAGRLDDIFKTNVSFLNFAALATNGTKGWKLLVLLKTRPKKKVSAISNTGVVTAAAHGFDGTLPIRVSRVKKNKYPNKIWSIGSVTADTFQLIGFDDPTPGGYALRFAIARPQLFGPLQIAGVQAIRATSHKTGRPTDLLSGKSKTKA
jgi:hypothetical protein